MQWSFFFSLSPNTRDLQTVYLEDQYQQGDNNVSRPECCIKSQKVHDGIGLTMFRF